MRSQPKARPALPSGGHAKVRRHPRQLLSKSEQLMAGEKGISVLLIFVELTTSEKLTPQRSPQ